MNDRFRFRVWNNKMQKFHMVFSMHGIVNDTLEGYAKDDNFVLEQCTGLKDKNGKLIYEGDIVKAFGFKDYYKLVCRFRDSSFCLDHIDGSPYNFAHSVSPIEVIGNIHENADLLENEE